MTKSKTAKPQGISKKRRWEVDHRDGDIGLQFVDRTDSLIPRYLFYMYDQAYYIAPGKAKTLEAIAKILNKANFVPKSQ